MTGRSRAASSGGDRQCRAIGRHKKISSLLNGRRIFGARRHCIAERILFGFRHPKPHVRNRYYLRSRAAALGMRFGGELVPESGHDPCSDPLCQSGSMLPLIERESVQPSLTRAVGIPNRPSDDEKCDQTRQVERRPMYRLDVQSEDHGSFERQDEKCHRKCRKQTQASLAPKSAEEEADDGLQRRVGERCPST